MRDGALGCTFKRKTDVVGGADQKISHFPDLARPHAKRARDEPLVADLGVRLRRAQSSRSFERFAAL